MIILKIIDLRKIKKYGRFNKYLSLVLKLITTLNLFNVHTIYQKF